MISYAQSDLWTLPHGKVERKARLILDSSVFRAVYQNTLECHLQMRRWAFFFKPMGGRNSFLTLTTMWFPAWWSYALLSASRKGWRRAWGYSAGAGERRDIISIKVDVIFYFISLCWCEGESSCTYGQEYAQFESKLRKIRVWSSLAYFQTSPLYSNFPFLVA